MRIVTSVTGTATPETNKIEDFRLLETYLNQFLTLQNDLFFLGKDVTPLTLYLENKILPQTLNIREKCPLGCLRKYIS